MFFDIPLEINGYRMMLFLPASNKWDLEKKIDHFFDNLDKELDRLLPCEGDYEGHA